MSQLKIKNGNEWVDIPAGGVGVPSGGTAGQVLKKSSNTDYATEWAASLYAPIHLTNLTTSKCTIQNNDCYQIGKLVIICLKVVLTASVNMEILVSGLPLPANNGGLGTTSSIVSLSSYNGTNFSLLATGEIYKNTSGSVSSGQIYGITGAYICQ